MKVALAIVMATSLLHPQGLWAQDAPQPSTNSATAPAVQKDPKWFKGAVRPKDPAVTPPVLVKSAKPRYTLEAMAAKVQGTVAFDARIEKDGRVSHLRLVQSVPMLDKEAEQAAKQFEFRPARKDGKAVPIILRIEIAFHMR